MLNTASEIKASLYTFADPQKAIGLSRFFKTGKGQYGEGDIFCGIKVPETRSVVKQCSPQTALNEIDILIHDPVHEVRLCGFLILLQKYTKTKSEEEKAKIIDFYLPRIVFSNNWDLVDLVAPKILGHWLLNHDRGILYKLSDSSNLWEQRVAIVCTHTLIAHHEYHDTLSLVNRQMNHPHDLMQKANGWMLREIGKRDRQVLTDFIEENATKLPRTTLRYAIEHYSPEERERYLNYGRQ